MINRVSLFKSHREIIYFIIICFCILLLSLSFRYYNYKQLTKFDSALIEATVIKQYTKTKNTKKGYSRTYQVLKLKSKENLNFYTITKKNQKNIIDKTLKLEVWCGDITFYEYLNSFFSYSKILEVSNANNAKKTINTIINNAHKDKNITSIYQALYTAKTLPQELQTKFSTLGISHLIAISGFHLGVLSAFLFFILKLPYRYLQNNYFPYRNIKIDLFIFIAITLLLYLIFLDYPPSLFRAFFMFLIGFILYDRGVKIVSMQTLFVSVSLILSFHPALFFSVGFWLSVSGVFYIFLFLIYFKELHRYLQFIFLPIWIYLMMLPYSVVLFHNFSIYHPLSILWSVLFSIFYPLSFVLHILHLGDLLDPMLKSLLSLNTNANITIQLSKVYLYIEILLSILAIFKKRFIYLLFMYTILIFIYLIYDIT